MAMLSFLRTVPGGEGREPAFLEGAASFLERNGFDSEESLIEADAANLKSGPEGAFNAAGLAFVRRVIGHVNSAKARRTAHDLCRKRLKRAPGRSSVRSRRERARFRFPRALRNRARGAHQEARRGAA